MEPIHLDVEAGNLKTAVERLRAQPDILDHLVSDPRSVLSQLGVTIDEATAQAIKAHAGRRTPAGTPAQAAIIHADT